MNYEFARDRIVELDPNGNILGAIGQPGHAIGHMHRRTSWQSAKIAESMLPMY